MKNNASSQSGRFNPRVFLSFALAFAGVFLAVASFMQPTQKASVKMSNTSPRPLRYMPEPGGKADDFDQMESEWFTRVTYPTGIFKSEWLRLAAAADAIIPRAIPAGIPG